MPSQFSFSRSSSSSPSSTFIPAEALTFGPSRTVLEASGLWRCWQLSICFPSRHRGLYSHLCYFRPIIRRFLFGSHFAAFRLNSLETRLEGKSMKTHRWFFTIVLLMLAFPLTQWIFGSLRAAQRQPNSTVAPKYIFFFLADGAGTAHMEITRQYNRAVHNEGLVIPDRIMKEANLGIIPTDAPE